jgi:hypothetical protein
MRDIEKRFYVIAFPEIDVDVDSTFSKVSSLMCSTGKINIVLTFIAD